MSIRTEKAPHPQQDEQAELENSLPSNSSVRRWRQQEVRSGDDLVQALKACDRSDWISHAVAYDYLCREVLSPSARKTATQILAQTLEEPANYGPDPIIIVRGLAAVFLVMSAWFSYEEGQRWAHNLLETFFGAGLLTVFVSPFVAWAAIGFNHSRMRRLQQVAVETLLCIGDAGCISALTLQVRLQSKLSDTALQALKRILPTVTAEGYDQLPSETTGALLYLAESFDPALALLALDALEQIGDSSCVLTIEKLAAQITSRTVQSRAAAVLPILYARRARQNAATTLLRASSENASEQLVRPVYDSDPKVDNLLRASHSESPKTLTDEAEG